MAVLDSTFLSDLLTRRPAAVAVLASLEREGAPLRVPAAVWIEILHTFPARKRSGIAKSLERNVVFVDMDRELADDAVRLQHDLRAEGAPLGWHDLHVAVTALKFHEPVVSNDRSFDDVPGLVRMSH